MKVRRPTLSDTQNPSGWMLECATQVNLLSEGKQAAHYASATAAPTTGTWAQGDFVKNSAPTEGGVALSKYVVFGWICTVGGTPGTWLQCRFLTGN
jgi:hypothetical protein